MTSGPYARVYHSIVDDPKFRRVYDDDAALSTWLRLLLVADAMYPASAPMPAMTPAVQLLLKVGLIKRRPGNRYIVTGLQAEREKRSENGRNAAALRWHRERNANPVLPDQSKAKTSNGATASNEPVTLMGFRPKPGTHAGQHSECTVCAPLRPT